MRFESKNFVYTTAVERQVQTRADSDFQNSTLSHVDGSFPIWREEPIFHRQIDQVGHNMIGVEAHLTSPAHQQDSKNRTHKKWDSWYPSNRILACFAPK
jgi:hypothetical protein